jgi:ABC-type polysaccharide/polyol phosphate export permease
MKYLPLIRLLVNRDLTIRYKRSVIGIGWTLLNPMLTSFVLWVVFSFAFGSRLVAGQQFAPYLMAGILLHTFFNQGTWLASESISSNSEILTKIYVPPQVFTISAAISAFVNFSISLLPLAIVVLISGQALSFTLPLVAIVGACMTLLVAGIGLMLSTLFVRFDDARNIVSVLLMIALYITPVFYPISILSKQMQTLINLNPLTSYLEVFRWAFSNNATPTFANWAYMIATSILSFAFGAIIFKRAWPRTVAML